MNFKASHRRNYLNQKIKIIEKYCNSPILDIGGENKQSRNWMLSSIKYSHKYITLNINEEENPDVIGDACKLPFLQSQFKTIFCFEVLEHIREPAALLSEINRVLSPQGTAFLSAPFLYPLHADPYDFQRWTHTKILSELLNHNFNKIKIEPLGGIFSAINDIILNYLWQQKFPRLLSVLIHKIFRYFVSPALYFSDKPFKQNSKDFTGGYFITAHK